MYLYECVILPTSECAVWICVSVCVMSNESTIKRSHYVSNLSKFDALFHKTHVKVLLVLSYQGLTCVHPYYH